MPKVNLAKYVSQKSCWSLLELFLPFKVCFSTAKAVKRAYISTSVFYDQQNLLKSRLIEFTIRFMNDLMELVFEIFSTKVGPFIDQLGGH